MIASASAKSSGMAATRKVLGTRRRRCMKIFSFLLFLLIASYFFISLFVILNVKKTSKDTKNTKSFFSNIFSTTNDQEIVQAKQNLEASASNKIRLLFVTSELRGVDEHGGIGAALYRLAKLLLSKNRKERKSESKTSEESTDGDSIEENEYNKFFTKDFDERKVHKNFEITVAYASHPYCVRENPEVVVNGKAYRKSKKFDQFPQKCNFDYWTQEYAKQGIKFIPLEDSAMLKQINRHGGDTIQMESFNCVEQLQSYKTYIWLRSHYDEYDFVHFNDYLGLGYYSLSAKLSGLFPPQFKMLFVVNLHGSSWFVNSMQHRLPQSQCHLMIKYMEEQSVAMADHLIAPSKFYLNWVMKHLSQSLLEFNKRLVADNVIAEKTTVLQNPFLDQDLLRLRDAEEYQNVDTKGHQQRKQSKKDKLEAGERRIAKHLVFFGRFSRIKGLHVFLQLIDRIVGHLQAETSSLSKEAQQVLQQIKEVTFLGNTEESGEIEGMKAEEYLEEYQKKWNNRFKVHVLMGKDTKFCLEYLSNEADGKIAIIPSLSETSSYAVLELLYNKVPFLASKVGGIPELVFDYYHTTNLFESNSFQAILDLLIDQGTMIPNQIGGILIPEPKIPLKESQQMWVDFYRQAQEQLTHHHEAHRHDFDDNSIVTLYDINSLKQYQDANEAWITVILVTFHACSTQQLNQLKATLDSLKAQTNQAFDVLLVDAGPTCSANTDKVDAIGAHELEDYIDNLKIIRAPEHSFNLKMARHYASLVSRGSHLLFLQNLFPNEHIDILHPGAIEIFINAIKNSYIPMEDQVFTGLTDSSFFDKQEATDMNTVLLKLKENQMKITRTLWLGSAVEASFFENVLCSSNLLVAKHLFEKLEGLETIEDVSTLPWTLGGEISSKHKKLIHVIPEVLFMSLNPSSDLKHNPVASSCKFKEWLGTEESICFL